MSVFWINKEFFLDITAIIAEYNPLHNGHVLHLQKTKEAFPSTNVVCIMSGSFSQRGEPTVCTERERAIWALKSGADAVVRLPLYSSFSNGESFAEQGVRCAVKIGAKRLSFGSECGDVGLLKKIADILSAPNESFKAVFDQKMADGSSYPRAICETMRELYPSEPYADVLKSPNDILGVLYIKALKGTDIEPFCVKREDNGYDSRTPRGDMLSASAIRDLLLSAPENIRKYVPEYVADDLLSTSLKRPDLSSVVMYKLRAMTAEELADIQDVTEGLENRIKKYASVCFDVDSLLDEVKTKRFTMARLKRILIYALFDVTKDKFNKAKSADYLRLLAIKKEKRDLLSTLSQNGVSKSFSELDKASLEHWLEENKMSDIHELLLQKTSTRNAIYW